jgi:chromosome transmission fidelity protein 4
VAIGANWAAAATSKQFLRIYSERAVQRAVVALPGPVVAMAGYKKHLAVVYHRTPAVFDRQNLELRLFDVETEQCDATISLGSFPSVCFIS